MFEVVVRRVPRRWLEVDPGRILVTMAGTSLHLVSVAIGARVEVILEALDLVSGDEGGPERPWRVRRCFMPLPPPQATALTVVVSADDDDPVSVQLALA